MFALAVEVRRAMTPERGLVLNWIETHFESGWANASATAFSQQPVTCFVAVKEGRMLGFAAYDVLLKGFFGPLGVLEAVRGHGIGRALSLYTLHAMREAGYGYAIISHVPETEQSLDYYKRVARATVIPHSEPGVYHNLLLEPETNLAGRD
jgi:GNAT superfamily N-acetyltransferase